MTTELSIQASARHFYETLNQAVSTGDMEPLAEVIHSDAIDHNPDPDMKPGLAGIQEGFGALRQAFPDARFIIEDLVAEGDKIACRITARATHRGEFLGVPATGRPVSWVVIDILRFTDGKLAERWGVVDGLTLLQQLQAPR